jgi:hypothetical protein
MALSIKCDICNKEIEEKFWRGKTHLVLLKSGKYKSFDVCNLCEEKLGDAFLKVVEKIFKVKGASAWKIDGDDDTLKIWG